MRVAAIEGRRTGLVVDDDVLLRVDGGSAPWAARELGGRRAAGIAPVPGVADGGLAVLEFPVVGLEVARDLTPYSSFQKTYNAFGKGESSLIDHFFVRNVKIKEFRTLDGDYGVPYISDHYPIEIIIRL